MTDDTLYDDLEAELDRLERLVLGELPDEDNWHEDDWHDVDFEADL